MADVARAAGVSAQTVSRVSTGRVNVDAETRERVVAAMQQLGYRPNRAARALKYGRFHSLGVIASNLTSYGTTRTVNAIAFEAARAGYSLTLIPLVSPDAAAVAGAFATLGEHSVDGIVVLIERHRLDAAAVTFPPGLPAVAVDTSRPTPYAVVDNDEQRGAALATEHLLRLGHTTVRHIAGPADSHSAEVRRLSWQATLERHGAQVPPIVRGDWSAESGYVAGVQLARDDSVTAIFAANDQMALGAMRALSESGRRIPQDVSRRRFRRHARVGQLSSAAHDRPPGVRPHRRRVCGRTARRDRERLAAQPDARRCRSRRESEHRAALTSGSSGAVARGMSRRDGPTVGACRGSRGRAKNHLAIIARPVPVAAGAVLRQACAAGRIRSSQRGSHQL